MTETITVYPYGTEERENLQRVADILTITSPNKITYHVENVYFDFGQDWTWTTITAYRRNGDSWQILNPKKHAAIIAGGDPLQAVLDLRNGPYWQDK